MILAIFDLQVTWYFLSSLESTGLSVQKFKTDFQDGDCGSHIGFLIRTNLAIFDLQMTLMLSTKFRDNWPVGSGEEAQHTFPRQQPWRLSWISDQNDFSYFFYLQVTPMLPTKYRVNWPFSSGQKVNNGFSRWSPWQPSWISDRNDFSYSSTSHPMLPTKFQVNWPFGSGEEVKTDFPDGGYLGFPIGTILAIFNLQNHPDASYQVSS